MKYLLIDFGASRVKTVIFDYKENKFSPSKDFKPVAPKKTKEGRFEVDPIKIINHFQEIVNFYIKGSKEKIVGIIICSEMHGFALVDTNGKFLTNYISWQDNRASEKIDGISTIEFARKNFPEFKKRTGMNIKNGLPAINLLHIAREGNITSDAKMISLSEIITNNTIKDKELVHSTILAGFGIWDIYEKKPYKELISLYKKITNNNEITLNKNTEKVEIAGYFQDIPIYTGVGDHQCTLLGIDLGEKTLSLNLGTGSQISIISEFDKNTKLEQRPFFNGKCLSVITHIPSGRALNAFVNFIQNILNLTESKKNAWDLLQKITLQDIKNSSLDINLAVFDSAFGFNGGGSITGIKENNLTIRNYFSSLLKSYIEQYLNIIDKFNISFEEIVLSSGIPSKLNVIAEYLKYRTGKNIITTKQLDETFFGLKNIVYLIKNS